MRVSRSFARCQNLGRMLAIGLAPLMFLPNRCGAQRAEAEPQPETVAGGWQQRVELEEAGVRPFAELTAEGWVNAAGGLRSGSWYNHLLDFGVELDTAKLGLWSGASFMAQFHWVQNSRSSVSFADYIGAFNPVSGYMASDHVRVYNLHYRQAWREEAIVFKVGQIAADDDFMGSEYAGLFANSAFGAMPSQVGTPLAGETSSAFPIYSVAAPGLFLAVRPAEPFEGQVGLYYGRPGPDIGGNYGWDWASQSPAELALFWEGAYHYQLAHRPATFRLGGTYHTGQVEDFASLNATGTTAIKQNVPNFYAIHDWALLATAEAKPVLGLFCRGGFTPEPDRSMVAFYADGGLNWFAPLPDRPDDVAGVAVSYTRFGREFRHSTGPDGMASDETTLELTYKAQLTNWLTLQADVQWLFNPAVSATAGSRATATVLGLRAQIAF